MATLVGLFSGCNIGHFHIFEPLHEETRTTNIPHQGNGTLEVDAVNGSIVVNQSDRDDVQVVAHLKATSPERLVAAEVVTHRDESGKLVVSVGWPEGKRHNREGCSFEVLIPDAIDVTLRTSSGTIELAGLGGKAELHTSNGTIKVKGHEGPLSVATSNGQIKIADATSRVDAKTSNGAITLSLAPEGPGPIDAKTSNGSITLNLSPAMEGNLTLTTSNGSVNVDPSYDSQIVSERKKHAVLRLGSSENQSNAKTSNGSIHVKRAVDISDPA